MVAAMKHDYACPNCRRVRRRESEADEMTFNCSCVGGIISCPRVRWELADWALVDQALADALGVGKHVVAQKREDLGMPKGSKGRKPYSHDRRRIDPAKIDPTKGVSHNARVLGCSRQRIHQLLKRA